MKKIFILILISAVVTQSCKKVFFVPEPAHDPESLFEDLFTNYKQNYGPTQERGIDWNDKYNRYRPLVNSATTEDELYKIVTSMLSELQDGHVQLTAPDKPVFFADSIRNYLIDDELFQLDVIKEEYLQEGFKEGEENSYTYGVIGDNIGYIHLDHIALNLFAFPDALDEFRDARGLIIDLRHNQGGDFTYAYTEMARLVKERTYVLKSRTKNGPATDDYTAWHEWYLEPEQPYFDKKIVVLTDRYTISAGERTAMALKALPNTIFIGERTSGAIATMIGRELANGWKYTFPIQEVEFRNGMHYEGIGIPVGIEVKNTLTELNAGEDAVLERAIQEF